MDELGDWFMSTAYEGSMVAWVTRVGGVMMIAVGVLLMTGYWDVWVGMLRGWIGSFATPV